MNIEEDLTSLKEIVAIRKERCHGFIESDSCLISTKRLETLLTAYENLKSYNKGTKEALRSAEELERQANKEAGDWEARCFELQQELEKEKEKNKEYKNLLIDMVNQFAYEDNNPKTRGSSEQKIYTAGLSTLEDAFYFLDIDEGIRREDLWKLKEE